MNQSVFYFLYDVREIHPLIPQLALVFGAYLPYGLVLGLAGYLFLSNEFSFKKRLFISIGAVFASSISYLSVLVARGFLEVERPFAVLPDITPLIEASDKALQSFPSGHAAVFFALAMFLYFYHKRLGAAYLAGAFLIGIGRVIAGIHWPLDILAGAGLGIFAAYLIRWFTLGIKRNL
ncbi:MAG: phosphatase PAP2 family protein [Candidatus Portnoybacteria bacterium]|nr:phosphatase PAP2 family protein [Candidatus Portnoybacteria bacterium]